MLWDIIMVRGVLSLSLMASLLMIIYPVVMDICLLVILGMFLAMDMGYPWFLLFLFLLL